MGFLPELRRRIGDTGEIAAFEMSVKHLSLFKKLWQGTDIPVSQRHQWEYNFADAYPDDTRARDELLKNTRHVADAFIRSDSHKVPFWQPGDAEVVYRPIQEGDEGNLWTWLDWMMSSSSNAAWSRCGSR